MPGMPDEPNAEPSPATEEIATEPPSLDSFTAEQRHERLLTGKLPTDPQPKQEESAPSQDTSAAEQAETAPESEPGKPEPETPEERSRRDKARNAQRWDAMLQENRVLKNTLAEIAERFGRGEQQAASPLAKTQETKEEQEP